MQRGDNVNSMHNPAVKAKRYETFKNKRRYIQYTRPVTQFNLADYKRQFGKLPVSVANEWLDTHHPQGSGAGNLLAIGVWYTNISTGQEQIISVITFKKPRNSEFNFELSRIWTIVDDDIAKYYFSELSKLASALGVYNIVAYANRTFTPTKWLEDIGMKLVVRYKPIYKRWANIGGRYYSQTSLLNRCTDQNKQDLPEMYWDTGTVQFVYK